MYRDEGLPLRDKRLRKEDNYYKTDVRHLDRDKNDFRVRYKKRHGHTHSTHSKHEKSHKDEILKVGNINNLLKQLKKEMKSLSTINKNCLIHYTHNFINAKS